MAKVKMKFLPQAGQHARVRYDAGSHELLDVLTPAGQEGAPPAGCAPTEEIPWNDTGHVNWWEDGARRR